MKTLRLSVFASLVAVLSACPSGDKCKDVMCPTGQSCDTNTGMCTTGGTGGGNGGTGGGSAGGGLVDAGPPPLMLSELCAKYAAAVCNKFERCQLLDSADKAVCIAARTEQCTLGTGTLSVKNVMAGNSTYNGVAAAECVNSFAVSDCADTFLPQRCADAVTGGRGQVGTPCSASSQCQADAGFYCQFNDFTPCDQCGARVGLGAFCAFDVYVLCQPGLTCDEAESDGGHCVGPPGINQSCDFVSCATDGGLFCQFSSDGGSDTCRARLGSGIGPCTSTTQCQTGLFCNTATDGGVSTCSDLRGDSQPCTATTQCQMGLYCPPATVTPRTCRPLLADGQGCTTGTQCMANYCNRDPFGLGFDAGARGCGYLNVSDTCFSNTDCGPGKHCNGWIPERADAGEVPGACANRDLDGGACTNSATLVTDSCLNPRATCLDSRCVETAPFSRMLGQTCDWTDPGFEPPMCGNGTRCSYADPLTYEGTCVAQFADGEECLEDAECMPGSYCDFDTLVCTRYARTGEPCDDSVGPYCRVAQTCNLSGDGGYNCGPLVTTGAPCNEFDGPQCYSSYCSPDAGMCSGRQANGALCTGPGQCSSNNCSNPDGGFDEEFCQMACY